jgi:hypothetical protein
VPIDTPASLKVTEPVGWPAPGVRTLTVAVKVTASPRAEGVTEEVTVACVRNGMLSP